MKKVALLTAALLMAVAPQAIPAEAADEDPVFQAADDFVVHALSSGRFEVKAGQLALKQAQSKRVQDFAHEMVTDHQAVNQKLIAVAQDQRITVPAEMLPTHQQKLEKLRKETGNFSVGYVQMQMASHNRAIQLYRAYVARGRNPALIDYAKETLPALYEHRDDAKYLVRVVVDGVKN